MWKTKLDLVSFFPHFVADADDDGDDDYAVATADDDGWIKLDLVSFFTHLCCCC